jgi:UDP-N-acetyl-D-galactosamine dehydrogenase
MLGYHPQVILAGRRINDGMAKFIAEKVVKEIIKAGHHVKGCIVNVMGLTFKENCPDLRNSKVADMIFELQSYGVDVHVHDPLADADEAQHEYGLKLESWDSLPRATVTIAAVSHNELMNRPLSDYQSKSLDNACFVDIKSKYDQLALSKAGFSVWRL